MFNMIPPVAKGLDFYLALTNSCQYVKLRDALRDSSISFNMLSDMGWPEMGKAAKGINSTYRSSKGWGQLADMLGSPCTVSILQGSMLIGWRPQRMSRFCPLAWLEHSMRLSGHWMRLDLTRLHCFFVEARMAMRRRSLTACGAVAGLCHALSFSDIAGSLG